MTLESISRAEASLPEAPQPASRLHPSIALAPYVEALVVGRRVAVLGDVTLGLADELVARGARLVHAYDPDPARVAEAIARKAPGFGSPAAGRPAARGVVHALLGDDLGVRDGAFDAVLVPDLALFADPSELVRRARKLVAPTGAVIALSPNPDAKRRLVPSAAGARRALSYYEVFDLLSLQFPVVRMVGQAPFVGYAIVDFAPSREPDVSFDASLMSGTEEPESFLAIASDRPISTDAYVVVEVPAADVLGFGAEMPAAAPEYTPAGPSSERDVHRAPSDGVQIAEMQARLVLMEAELDDLRSQKTDLVRQAEAARQAAEDAQAEARGAREERHALSREAARADETQAERWRELEARAGDEHVRAERLTHKVRDLEEELVRQRDRAQRLTKQLDDEKRTRQKAEIELGMARGLPTKAEPDPEMLARVQELEAALSQASAREAELAEALRLETARSSGLANELLAKSKETAELRREHEAAELKLVEARREREAAELKLADERREREAAVAKVAHLTSALAAAEARIEEVDEQVQTMRRPIPMREPVVVGGEVESGMMARIARMEAAANEGRRAAEESKRAAEESKRALDLLAAQRDAAIARAEKLETQLQQERGERKDMVAAKAALEAEVIGLRRRIEEISTDQESEAAPEVVKLEAALRDRGHRIAALERDLRESERIGRELISEIEAARAHLGPDDDGGGFTGGGPGGSRPTPGGLSRAGGPAQPTFAAAGAQPAATTQPAAPSAPGAVDALTADAFQHHIDALAADAAQKQAELLTSTWKIQALERELETARTAASDPPRIQRELSDALVRAQAEIANLRRALNVDGREGTGVPRAVVEDSVLLHQQLAR
jgi:hypothetical protein